MVRNLHDETHTFTLDAHESLTIPLGPYNGGWDEQHEWYRRDLKGFGVRSWRELPGQVWQLRVTNQATGSQTYVSSEKFCVRGQWWQLDNGSDATIHYRPSWDVDSAIVTAAHRSAVSAAAPTQGVAYGSCGMILSSDFRTLS